MVSLKWVPFQRKPKSAKKVKVKVKPNSKVQKIQEEADGSLIVHLKSPLVDGKANEELIQLLSANFDVPKSHIRIKSGLSSRQKLIEIDTDT
jgi:uncharacterized protein (TIGR00251 family)